MGAYCCNTVNRLCRWTTLLQKCKSRPLLARIVAAVTSNDIILTITLESIVIFDIILDFLFPLLLWCYKLLWCGEKFTHLSVLQRLHLFVLLADYSEARTLTLAGFHGCQFLYTKLLNVGLHVVNSTRSEFNFTEPFVTEQSFVIETALEIVSRRIS
jgi:hypothetical protein